MKIKVVTSSLGCKTSESMARRIDELLPTIPNELRRLATKSSTKSTEVGEDRTDISTITTSHPDRDLEMVLPDGIQLDSYRANPIVLFGHNQDTPCGKCLWIKPTGDGLSAKTKYPARPAEYQGEWIPDFVYGMVAAEVLKGKSIGFLPLEIRDPEPEELALFPDVQRVITKSLLCEYSCVAIPCNPQALVEAINKGLTSLDKWGYTKVGRVKKVKNKVYKQPVVKLADYDINKIVDEVIKSIHARWEA